MCKVKKVFFIYIDHWIPFNREYSNSLGWTSGRICPNGRAVD